MRGRLPLLGLWGYFPNKALPSLVLIGVTPVGRLVGAAAEVDGELGDVRVGAGQHRQQLHEVHGPYMPVGTAV